MDDFSKLQALYDPALDDKYHISLRNFDEHKSGPPYLTSPRSIEACLRQGVKPKELIVRCERGDGRCSMSCVGDLTATLGVVCVGVLCPTTQTIRALQRTRFEQGAAKVPL